MKKNLFLYIILFSFCLSSWAQHPGFSRLYNYSGDTLKKAEGITSLVYDTASSLFFFSTSAVYLNNGSRPSVFYKANDRGGIEKEVLDTIPGGNIIYYGLAESRDGIYLYWAGSCYTRGDTQSFWVLHKTDKDLNTIWKRTYPIGALEGFTLKVIVNAESDDLSLLCSKYTNTPNSFGLPRLRNRIYIRTVDSAGNVLSENSPGQVWNAPTDSNDMALTDDGGYMTCGRTFAWGQRDGSAFALKSDDSGEELWHEFYAQDAPTCFALGITRTFDLEESFIIVGSVAQNGNDDAKGFVNKIDGSGNQIWRKDITKNNSRLTQSLWAIGNAQDSKIIAAGSSRQPEVVSPRGWMVLLDSDGNEIQSRIVTAFPRDDDHEYLYRVLALPDGSYVAAGTSFGLDADGFWTQQGWLVRVDGDLCMDPTCSGDITRIESPLKKNNDINLYPNPAKDHIYIEGKGPFLNHSTTVRLVDALGRTVRALPKPSGAARHRYDIGGIAPGTYYLQVTADGETWTGKVVIVP